jgi:hypothetical protein
VLVGLAELAVVVASCPDVEQFMMVGTSESTQGLAIPAEPFSQCSELVKVAENHKLHFMRGVSGKTGRLTGGLDGSFRHPESGFQGSTGLGGMWYA